MTGPDRADEPIDLAADHRLAGEGVARWVPALLALIGLAGAMAAAALAVAAVDDGDDLSTASASPDSADSDPGSTDRTTTSSGTDSTVAPSTTTTAPASTTTTAAPTTTTPQDCPPAFVVRFALGAAVPIDDHESQAGAMAAWLADHPDARLLLDGHADAGGSEETNLRLSFRRAEAVAALLVSAGADVDRLQARGFGEYQPIVGAAPDSEANRRVTMQVDGLDTCPIDDEESDR